MKKIEAEKIIKAGRFEIRKGLCSCITISIDIGAENLFRGQSLDHPSITHTTLYKMLDSGLWDITEFSDGIRLNQIGIEIFIYYARNGIQIPADQKKRICGKCGNEDLYLDEKADTYECGACGALRDDEVYAPEHADGLDA